jgi:hypothetical protein
MEAPNTYVGLNKHLIASIYPMKRQGDDFSLWVRDDSQTPFEAPVTQATLEMVANWVSPYENSGVEAKFSGLAQMAQAGLMSNVLHAIGGNIPPENERTKGFVADIEESAKKLVGRTGQTVLNSYQIYASSPPVKIQLTCFLSAYKSPILEVEEQLKRLQSWVVPRKLAKDGVITNIIKNGASLLSLMPSETPTIVGLSYKNRLWNPLVIESCSDPIGADAPISRYGNRVSAVVNLTLCSLTAFDKDSWADTYPAEYL